MNVQSIVTTSSEVIDPYIRLSTSIRPYHRIVFAALKALAHCEGALRTSSELNAQLLLPEDSSLNVSNQLVVLRIIHEGLKKYEFLHILNKPVEWVSDCRNVVNQRILEILTEQKRSDERPYLDMLIDRLSNEEGSDLNTEFCLDSLVQIKNESRGLHIEPALVVNQYIGSSEEEIPRLTQIVNSLSKLRKCKKLLVRWDKEAQENLNMCSKDLTQYLKTQIKDISKEDIEAIKPQTPELLEIIWEAIRLGDRSKMNSVSQIFQRELGHKISFPGLLHLDELKDLKKDILDKSFITEGCSFAELNGFKREVDSRIKGLRIWLSENPTHTQSSIVRNRTGSRILDMLFDEDKIEIESIEVTEVLKSLELYERCLRQLDIQRVSCYGFPIRDWN